MGRWWLLTASRLQPPKGIPSILIIIFLLILIRTKAHLPGYRIVKSFGVVRGIIVRSRSIIGNIGAGLQSIFGGNISLYTSLCERTREDAFNQMLTHAGQLGANAVIGVRYDATEIGKGITEVLCYGTAVYVEQGG